MGGKREKKTKRHKPESEKEKTRKWFNVKERENCEWKQEEKKKEQKEEKVENLVEER